MAQVVTLDRFAQIPTSDSFRKFVVAVDTKELRKALEDFASAGRLLPAVCDETIAASVRSLARKEEARRAREDREKEDIGDEIVASARRFFVGKKAEILGGEVPDWALEGKFTLFQRDLLAQFVGADSTANHGDIFSVHPNSPNRYLKVESFHRTLFAERVDEILRLVQSLCPKTIELKVSEDQYRKLGGTAGLTSILAASGLGSVAAEFKQSTASQREAVFTEKYDRQPHAPTVPDDLHMIGNTPEFKNLKEGRLNHYQRETTRTFRFTESYGVDANLSARAGAADMKIGADLEAGVVQEITLKVEWWPMPDAVESVGSI